MYKQDTGKLLGITKGQVVILGDPDDTPFSIMDLVEMKTLSGQDIDEIR